MERYTSMLTAALFTTATAQSNPGVLNKQIMVKRLILMQDDGILLSARTKNEILASAATGRNLENIMLMEKSDRER